jgi:hypothetical protein
LTWGNNAFFLWEWEFGYGDNQRSYGPNDIETQELLKSFGAEELRKRFYDQGCKGFNNVQYAHWDAYLHSAWRLWDTSAQVGGFAGASVTPVGGMLEFDIPNDARRSPFYDGALSNNSDPWGPERTIHQRFKWTEPLSACKCK